MKRVKGQYQITTAQRNLGKTEPKAMLTLDDFFLFVVNDNDFQSSDVKMSNAAGTLVSYGDGRFNANVTNDAMFYIYRLSIDASSKKFFRFEVE